MENREFRKSGNERKPMVTNTSNWKPGAVEAAIEIAQELGLTASVGEKNYGADKPSPVLIVKTPQGESLTSFWNDLNKRVPDYWKPETE